MKCVICMLMFAVTVIPPASQAPSFEAATIKPNSPGSVTQIGGSCHGTDSKDYGTGIFAALGRCRFVNITLADLLSGLNTPGVGVFNGIETKVTGGPSWADSDRWEIQAKAEDATLLTESQLRQMLRALIVERFKLRFDYETKDVQGFVLVVAKSGPKFTEDHSDAEGGMSFNGKDATFRNSSISNFARFLSSTLRAPVVNKTELTAGYKFDFHILRRQTGDADSPSIFTAVQEQLGLRLESAKVPVETLVIDSVERPSEN